MTQSRSVFQKTLECHKKSATEYIFALKKMVENWGEVRDCLPRIPLLQFLCRNSQAGISRSQSWQLGRKIALQIPILLIQVFLRRCRRNGAVQQYLQLSFSQVTAFFHGSDMNTMVLSWVDLSPICTTSLKRSQNGPIFIVTRVSMN